MRKRRLAGAIVTAVFVLLATGCGSSAGSDGKTVVTLFHYKLEASDTFRKIQERFNETHDDIELKIESPNEAITVLKTRLVREDYPDIVGIGGDIDYSNFLDADLFMDISDFEGTAWIKPEYMEIEEQLELLPEDGTYALPYMANCAGILYNRDMFEENGWEIPGTWSEFLELCDGIRAAGITPIYLGLKDTWTCMSPWNSLAVSFASADVCSRVSAGETTFAVEYAETAEKIKALLDLCEPNPYAYSYNDACIAFARGEAAMYPIGSYAAPQILSVNPDMNIGSFTFPAHEDEADNVLTSGVDLQFSVMKECKNKEAAYEVLRFLYEDELVQMYADEQNAIPCKEGEFMLPTILDGMKEYLESGRVGDFHDHHYPSEMSVSGMIQTYLMDDSENAAETFLNRFDTEWIRYNRDLIARLKEYEEGTK